MSDAQAPAGWFPDPEDSAHLRYWDGAAWTEHRHPVEPAVPGVAPAPAYGAVPYATPTQNVPALVGLILAIIGTVLGLVVGVFLLLGIAGGIVSIVGLLQANRMRLAGTPGDRRGLALAGIIVGFGGILVNLVVGGLAAVAYYSF